MSEDDEPVVLPISDELDLHTFAPRDVGSLVPEWLRACREAGLLQVRLVHGKGKGALRAGVVALVERSALVRSSRADGNWGAMHLALWDPATDEARVRAILAASSRWMELVAAVRDAGPPDAWIGAGALRNRVWHHFHRRDGEPEDTDIDVAWFADGDIEVDRRWEARLNERLAARWEVVDQGRYGATSAEDGMSRWPETATSVAARLRPQGLELFAAHGWTDLIALEIQRTPDFPERDWAARLAAKQWRLRFPWVRIGA